MPIDFANAQSTNAKTIPVIDVSGAISGDGINGVADAIYAAAINHGFLYLEPWDRACPDGTGICSLQSIF